MLESIKSITVGQIIGSLVPVVTVSVSLIGATWYFVEPAYTAGINEKIEAATKEKFDTVNRNTSYLNDKLATQQQSYNRQQELLIQQQEQIRGLRQSLDRQNRLLELLINQNQ